mgnify:CR=1 FL=1
MGDYYGFESRGLGTLHEVSSADDATTDDEIAGNVAESKSPTITSPSDQLHPILLEDCTELGNVVKSHELFETSCKSEVHNNNVIRGVFYAPQYVLLN